MPAIVVDRVFAVAPGKDIGVAAVAADQDVLATATGNRVVRTEPDDAFAAIGLPAGKQPRLHVCNCPDGAVVEADLLDLILVAGFEGAQNGQLVVGADEADDQAVGRIRGAIENDLRREVA
ncbi:hypothetical protein D9M69_557360 [compost metagenome]